MGKPAAIGVDANGTPPAGDQANAVVTGTFSAAGPGKNFAFWGPFNVLIWPSIATALTTTAGSVAYSVGSGTSLATGSAVNSVNVPPGTTLQTLSGTSGNLALPTISQTGILNTSSAQISGLAITAGLVGSTVTGTGIPSGTTVLSVLVAADPTASPIAKLGTVQISAVPTVATSAAAPYATALDFALTGNAITVTGADAAATFTDAALTYDATINLERSFDGGVTWQVCNIGGQGTPAQYKDSTAVSLSVGESERNVLYRLNCTEYTSVSNVTINYRMSQTGAAALSLAVASAI